MTFSSAMRISIPSDVLVQELQGESVLLNLSSGRYFGLDEMGTRMWSALTSTESIESAYEVLVSEYEVDADRLQHDLHALIEKLVGHGLVEVNEK